MKKHLITRVDEDGIAYELGIEPGDFLLKINNNDIEDIFDYHFLVNDEYLEVLIEKSNSEEWLLEIDKDFEEDLGMYFEESLMDNYRSCHNKCIFCFIDQNPPGMRETIYFKDDDSRLSFLQGNYISLTNMKEKDIDRIIKYKLAPINISIHTTNPELRCKMLNNRFAGNVLSYIDKLYNAEIPMNAQIVLCKGVNDKEELKRTIGDLIKYAPMIKSLSVVPVGLTKYRERLFPLEPFNKDDSKEVIDLIHHFQNLAMKEFDYHFVHASDEWYINAEYDIPDEDNYDGYIQLENGVGMTRLLVDEFRLALEKFKKNKTFYTTNIGRKVSTFTGKLAFNIHKKLANELIAIRDDIEFNVYDIKNIFFGEKITVTGLLTGQDILEQLKDKDLGDALLVPKCTLKADENVFLDDMTLEELQNALQVKIIIVELDGMQYLKSIVGMEID